MNGLPDPYPNGTYVVVRGRTVVVTEHAPNADGWRYHGTPSSLIGDTVQFSHDEATPVQPTSHIPEALAQLRRNRERVEAEKTTLEALALWVHGHLSDADLRMTYITYRETTA